MGPIVFGKIAAQHAMTNEMGEGYRVHVALDLLDPSYFEKEVVESDARFDMTRALTDGEGDISIATDRGLYSLIYNMQEEAHRFAVKSVQEKKRKTLRRSSLEGIPGIGPKKAAILLSHYGSIARIREADIGELAALPGITETDGRRIRAHFEKKDGT